METVGAQNVRCICRSSQTLNESLYNPMAVP